MSVCCGCLDEPPHPIAMNTQHTFIYVVCYNRSNQPNREHSTPASCTHTRGRNNDVDVILVEYRRTYTVAFVARMYRI